MPGCGSGSQWTGKRHKRNEGILSLTLQKNTELIKEFNRYVREHPQFAEQIPNDAAVILQLEGDVAGFTKIGTGK